MKSDNLCHYLKPMLALIVVLAALVQTSACAVATPGTPPSPSSDLVNNGLVIRYLTAPKQLEPSGVAFILCVATDESNSALSYEWSATGGEIEIQNEPDEIIWTAPDKTGNYTVTVVVTNTKGIQATKSTNIVVTNDPSKPPAIVSMTCLNCKNIIEASRFNEYNIKCDISNPSGDTLHYTWFATIGRIKGNGPIASWLTGSQYGNALITVIVTDDKGNKTEGYLAINVSCCK